MLRELLLWVFCSRQIGMDVRKCRALKPYKKEDQYINQLLAKLAKRFRLIIKEAIRHCHK